MKKLTGWLLAALASVAMVWAVLSTAYTHSISEELSDLRRENSGDFAHLRFRIRELESELSDALIDRLLTPADGEADPADGDAETAPATSETVADTASPAETVGDADETENTTDLPAESVTLPVHRSPETQPAEAEAIAPTALYLLAEHEGVIGVFDASGDLLRTLNVFVFTLPEADRAALEVGIPAHSWQEMEALIAGYE